MARKIDLHSARQSAPVSTVDPSIARFLDAVWMEQGLSVNTLAAYRADLTALSRWLEERRIAIQRTTRPDLEGFLAGRHKDGAQPRSSARQLSSFRRYFRLEYADTRATQIVMDAPPDKEDCTPFVHASSVFGAAGLHVPALLAQDLQQGFLLLEDLGHTTFLDALQRDDAATPDALYGAAIGALVKLQCASQATVFPDYDAALLMRQLQIGRAPV